MSEAVGFTGTRHLTVRAARIIRSAILALPSDVRVITGGCIGVDAYAARVAKRRGLSIHTILPADRSRVDPGWERYADTFAVMPPGSDYRDRDVALVEASDRLIAVPAHPEHDPRSRRSGTWMTVRIARGEGKDVEVHMVSSDDRPTRADRERRQTEPGAGQLP